MTIIPLGERPPPPQPPKGLTPFALGFRPFFAAAALAGLLLMALWLLLWSGALPPPGHFGLIGWHSHEMLFGYTGAVIAGFLLTAVRNWTSIDTLTGRPLAALSLVWLLGRLVPFAGFLPGWLIALVDCAFLPLLAAALYRPLMRGENRINRVFLPLLLAMALANLLVHLQALGITSYDRGDELMLNLILLLLVLVSGRVLPFFTEKAVAGSKPAYNQRREQWAFASIIGWTLAVAIYPQPWLLALLALGVAATQGWRLLDWHHPKVWRIPILWVLFTGLLWFIIGFLLKALTAAGFYPDNLATHALTTGAIGIMTLGMMARVALGHTGRSLQPVRLVEISFAMLNLAVLLRVFAPVLLPELTNCWIHLSGGLWLLCFLFFSIYYLPLLLKPRVDGRPG